MSFILDMIDSLKWLTVWEMVLGAIDFFVLLRYALPVIGDRRWLDFIPGAGVLVALLSFLNGDSSLLALLFYASSAILFICTAGRLLKSTKKPMSPKRRITMAAVGLLGVSPVLLALFMAGEVRYNPVSDFSHKSYSEAFVAMNERLSVEYPFGDWKKIDWEETRKRYEPLFAKAEKDKDSTLYYKTLRDYLFSFRDGHIRIENDRLYENNEAFRRKVGGGVGISALRLDNGNVVVCLVLPGSPADKAGIELGAVIVSWDGKAAREALEQTTWSEKPMATEGEKLYQQGRFMTRSPIGKQVRTEWRNPGKDDVESATLTAYDDQYETLKRTTVKLKKEELPVEGRIVGKDYGYIKIRYFLPGEKQSDPAKELEKLLLEFQKKKIKGLVLDLRDNPGGDDDMVANMAGHFVSEKRIYEYVSYYNRYTGDFRINRVETRTVKPSKVNYSGKIAVLVNHNTGSSGEGLPLFLKGLPNVRIVGFTSTNGSFGVVSAPIEMKMPGGFTVRFPDGRSLNRDKTIQGDSDDRGIGGAAPDLVVPMDDRTFRTTVIDGQDAELNVAMAFLENG
ncbi:S41 family peptidase [Cohnella soli]|uniref:S41 family peptidase n=1 Tax=Cohnella soli TaxID=425005 RepID=A0ABW0HWX4_9BACL